MNPWIVLLIWLVLSIPAGIVIGTIIGNHLRGGQK